MHAKRAVAGFPPDLRNVSTRFFKSIACRRGVQLHSGRLADDVRGDCQRQRFSKRSDLASRVQKEIRLHAEGIQKREGFDLGAKRRPINEKLYKAICKTAKEGVRYFRTPSLLKKGERETKLFHYRCPPHRTDRPNRLRFHGNR